MAGLSELAAPSRDDGRGEQGRLRAAGAATSRAQTAQIYVAMGAMSVEEVRAAERLDGKTEGVIAGPVLAP